MALGGCMVISNVFETAINMWNEGPNKGRRGEGGGKERTGKAMGTSWGTSRLRNGTMLRRLQHSLGACPHSGKSETVGR